jgi:hypothetical protein
LFKYQNVETWNQLHNSSNNKNILKPNNITQLLWNDYATACKHSKFLALLIQHLKGIKTLADKIYDVSETGFMSFELLYVLFQIYVPLGLLKDNFTHYDLHSSNVVLYTPAKGKYIEYHYHLSGGREIVFKSQYIAKIIDYGRCYFKDYKLDIDSKKIYHALCAEPACKYCGDKQGFYWLTAPKNPHYMNSQARNVSYDLRLLNEIKREFKYIPYMNIPVIYKINTGTPEVKETGLPTQINNVQDAADHFISEVKKEIAVKANNKFYEGFTSLGQLHIYCNDDDKPMEFIPK